jgi:hypothetical protein
MSRILLARELGGNYGHLSQALPDTSDERLDANADMTLTHSHGTE